MPEEINRLATDVLCDVLWTPSPDADENLRKEGIPLERITRVGNIMLDSFEMLRPQIEAAATVERLGLGKDYAVVTLHRPSNVDQPEKLSALVEALIRIRDRLPIVFPVHPRTRARLSDQGFDQRLAAADIRLVDPLSYVEFMNLILGATVAITDSGGIQEETTYLGIPCLTLRDNTERPITIEQGTNRLATAGNIAELVDQAMVKTRSAPRRPALWDGRTADRCVLDLLRRSQGESDSSAAA